MFLAEDCTSSQMRNDKESALKTLQAEGVKLWTSETIAYDLVKTSEHPEFKNILKFNKIRRDLIMKQ